MPPDPEQPASSAAAWLSPRRAAALLVVAVALAYAGSFSAPFVFDASPIATAYPTIRHLWPLSQSLHPPHDGSTIEGRPLLNFSLALSYALSGIRVWGYHLLNLLIHLGACLALFGIIRRTLERKEGQGAAATALIAALWWGLHPLQTESVTYVIQRAESQMGLFFLLALYGFVRASEGGRRLAWQGLSVAACLLGMASKEVMAAAPVLILLYDRTFVAGTFREAWRRRRGYYGALAATWILLGWLVLGSFHRNGTAGFGGPIPWGQYALTQVYGIAHYLRLALWPRPLVFDYGVLVVTRPALLLPSAAVLLALLGLAAAGLASRREGPRAAGFLAAWFLVPLAPTALVPITTETLAEHRLYLSLAAVAAGGALALRLLCGPNRRAFLGAGAALALGLGAVTVHRNTIYRSEERLWADTLAKLPENPRALVQYGAVLFTHNRVDEAATLFRRALKLQPANFWAHYNLGSCYFSQDRFREAVGEYGVAVAILPKDVNARGNLGNALSRAGDPEEAIGQYEEALRLDPAQPEVRDNLARAQFNWGNLLAGRHDMAGAAAHYDQALRANPAYAEAQDNWGNALLEEGRAGEAAAHYRRALTLRPNYPEAHANLGNALLRQDRVAEAAREYQEALRLKPDYPEARAMLERIRAAGVR
ncbi:MAG TPA: tetratricopeptide repeat protein [Opitutaceae bacterium]|nr:tetratricopeptide repeat protein [Opitutaceae bacterium]